MFEQYTPIINLASALGAITAASVAIAHYAKTSKALETQARREALQDFRDSDTESTVIQLQQYLLGNYVLSNPTTQATLRQLLSDYEVHCIASADGIQSILRNNLVFRRNLSISDIENDIHHLIERTLHQLETLDNAKVDKYEYSATTKFLYDALRGLAHCNLGSYHSNRQSQLERIEAVLKRLDS
jgi:hypothetical protein